MDHGETSKKIVEWLIENIAKYSLKVLGGIIVLFLGWLVAKFICRFVHDFLDQHHVDATVTKFVVGAVRLGIMAFAILIALGKFGIEIAPFIAGLSVVGFGTSFALQGPLSNYASGATLIFTKPFKVGVIRDEVRKEGRIHNNEGAKVGISDFGDSSVNLYARLWCKQKDYWDVLFNLNRNIFASFKAQGVEIPFPQRDVHLFPEGK